MGAVDATANTDGASTEMLGAERSRAKGVVSQAGRPAAQPAHAGQDEHTQDDACSEHDARIEEMTQLGRAFKQVFRALTSLRGRETHLTGGQLGHAQYELLFELREHSELSAGQLAAAAQLSPASVTQMLEHLALSGHVERARLECDRRVVVSRLTARGRREIEAKRARWQGRWEQALVGVDAAELRAATRVLARLSAIFEDETNAG
jgi:DNA-binding MarR family transcriptional regulator